ncbi:unnamed protein product [Rotaria sp. Silwood1]|nr:unnamed protein product [Rotaria sp. Silwood1]CAF1447413.1 unnamed protein product [Rotaria sp. Silwood1]CAF3592900.1 unnamed protein product [Rotaria sp. Silwood1]CAF3721528.1 unnamed protein product [Rotaria sp. Silwood1]CAF4597035.1 unnamed protein product [Rotaria sp. Silwood1]
MSNRYQWLWKSNIDPWQINIEEQWERYSDIEMTIIENAYQKDCSYVELDNFIIDLKHLIQINKIDSTKQRPIKRISTKNLQCLREERFFFTKWMSPKFIEEWIKRNPRITLCQRVEKAAQGILEEGHLVGKFVESQWLAEKLLEVKEKSWDDIALCCLFLYTRECFLYKLLNKTLREEDLSKVDTLGPFCDFLWNSLSSESLKSKYQFTGLVYRGASLELDEIDAYKNSIKKYPKEWLGFSSTSKNRTLAETYSGNTLFIINVPSQSQHLDISNISNFPEEEEVLLGASTSFQIENVKYDETTGKNYIYLRILW